MVEYVDLNLISSKYSVEEFKQKVERVEGVLNVEITPVPLAAPSSEKKEDND